MSNATITEEIHAHDLEILEAVTNWTDTQFVHDNASFSSAVYIYFTPPTGDVTYQPDVSEEYVSFPDL